MYRALYVETSHVFFNSDTCTNLTYGLEPII